MCEIAFKNWLKRIKSEFPLSCVMKQTVSTTSDVLTDFGDALYVLKQTICFRWSKHLGEEYSVYVGEKHEWIKSCPSVRNLILTKN